MPKGTEKPQPSLWWLVDRDGSMRLQCIAHDPDEARAEFLRQRGTSIPARWKIVPAPKEQPAAKSKPARECELEDRKVILTKALAERVDFLGSLCGLTGDQMTSAIIVLHMNQQGWIGMPKSD